MAGGKLTPRQKMINLMYLVFIAMLALNMSKEVLSAFGLMNDKFVDVNNFSKSYNQSLYDQLSLKASDNAAQFAVPFGKAKELKPVVDNFYAYLESVKTDITKDFPVETDGVNKGKLPFEAMDKSTIDEAWFQGDGYSTKGKEITKKIEDFKGQIAKIVGTDVKYKFITDDVNKRFNTADVTDGEGVKKKYLDYHFKGFPAIASVTKISAMQNDAKKTEQDIYNALIGNTTAAAASMKNYKAIVITEKSAYFQGEAVTGRIVLGRYDESTVPTAVVVNGQNVEIENGQAVFKFGAGNLGENPIKGKFTFLEDGKEVPIDIEGQYVVVPKPNSATISADKMNVVYRGVANPMTISFAGVPDNKVVAQAAGLTKGTGNGKYNLNAGAGSEVTINVTGTLDDGQKVSDKKVFRIKGLPAPTGKIRGETSASGPKTNLEVCTISAVMEDFDFPVDVRVSQFNIKVPGQATVVVNGDRMNSQAKAAIARASKGDVVVISEIKAVFNGIDQKAKAVSACTYEIK